MKFLRLGLEIEAEYNREYIDRIKTGDYHHPETFTTMWGAERDGSLDVVGFEEGDVVEFTSKVLSAKTFFGALEHFEKKIKSLAGEDLELFDVLNFNSSCGAHIHFSLSEDKTLPIKIIRHQEVLLREIVIKNMKGAAMGDAFITLFDKQYYRSYALSASNNGAKRDNKYNSLNFHTRKNTVEWRSFNLRPVRTWKEFHLMYRVAYNSIIEFIHLLQRESFSYEERLALSEAVTKRKHDSLLADEITSRGTNQWDTSFYSLSRGEIPGSYNRRNASSYSSKLFDEDAEERLIEKEKSVQTTLESEHNV